MDLRAASLVLALVAGCTAAPTPTAPDAGEPCGDTVRSERCHSPLCDMTCCERACVGGVWSECAQVGLICDPLGDAGPNDAAPTDANITARTCDEALPAVRDAMGRLDCVGDCFTSITCVDFGPCWSCPYELTCPSGTVHVRETSIVCDAGPMP